MEGIVSDDDSNGSDRVASAFARRERESAEYHLSEELAAEMALATRVREQVSYIRDEFAKANIEVQTEPSERGVGFMYAAGQILVRQEYLGQVWDILWHIARESDGYRPGVTAPGLPADEPQVPEPEQRGAGRVQVAIDDRARRPSDDGTVNAGGGGSTVRDGDADGDQPEKPGDGPGRPRGYRPVVAGVVLLQLPYGLEVLPALDVIDRILGEGIATPNHVLTVAPEVGPCPATEPEVVYEGIEPSPGVCMGNSGAGVLIYVADTGLLHGADHKHPWLRGVRRGRRPDGALQHWEVDRQWWNGEQVIPPYAGHGTFVAGVIRCMAPQSDVIVSNVFKVAGSALESHFVRELVRALNLGVDLFHLSITTPTRWDLPLLAFEGWLKLLGQHKGTACIVAAGNNGSRHPFWPAAFPGVLSVGALAADLRDRADFSNYGSWVDVYAPGRNLVNAYAHGTYVCRVDPYKNQKRQFYGMARWSGTSFSTPVVTGLIAARMSRTGESGKQATAALLALAQCQAIPGVGPVLVPCSGSRGPGACCREGCDCSCHRENCDCGCRRPGAC
jgi:subtilisin family serine protease